MARIAQSNTEHSRDAAQGATGQRKAAIRRACVRRGEEGRDVGEIRGAAARRVERIIGLLLNMGREGRNQSESAKLPHKKEVKLQENDQMRATVVSLPTIFCSSR